MFPSRIPKKFRLQCWAGQGHKTYMGSERVQYITPYATHQLQITAISHHSGSLYLRSPLLISKWPNEWFHPHMALFTRTYAQAGLYITCPDLFKTGQGRRKKDEKWTREKFFFFIFGNFVCGDVREEVGVWKLDVDILEMCREFEVGGRGVWRGAVLSWWKYWYVTVAV